MESGVPGNGGRELYYDSYFGLHAVKIGPGELYASRRNILIVTVLGSCVSACLRDPAARVGGMNHFMLPEHSGNNTLLSEPARYGAHAMEMLIKQSWIRLRPHGMMCEGRLFNGLLTMLLERQDRLARLDSIQH